MVSPRFSLIDVLHVPIHVIEEHTDHGLSAPQAVQCYKATVFCSCTHDQVGYNIQQRHHNLDSRIEKTIISLGCLSFYRLECLLLPLLLFVVLVSVTPERTYSYQST